MCGRVVIPGTEEILKELPLQYDEDHRPSQINIPPAGIQLPIYTDSKPDKLQYFHWPLLPYWTENKKVSYSTSNATIENLKTSVTWKRIFGRRHCVIITSGFYEWQSEDLGNLKSKKHPHVIKTKGSKLTLMAGLWTAVKDPLSDEFYPSCSMITVPANELMKEIHNTKGRMPAFLTEETARIWCDTELPPNERESALHPVESDFLVATKINSVTDEDEVYGALMVC